MPPSGFNDREAEYISNFAKSIITRLKQEVKDDKHENIEDAVDTELDIIGKLRSSLSNQSAKHASLVLSRQVYFSFKRNDYDTLKTLTELYEETLAINV
ncbi:MAG: hypothetical protein OEX08_02630 [Candidatus Nomurabacteria bacterium]|nr:hypothetical protein [Candidatus Nomurabacteria bacterium]